MLDIQTPSLITFCLPAIVFIWWLHRRGAVLLPQKTAFLFLWNKLAARDLNAASERKIDKRWMLRAIIVCLCILAASNPFLNEKKPDSIMVWFDDSMSLATREGEGKEDRFSLIAKKLQYELQNTQASQFLISSLYDSTHILHIDRSQLSDLDVLLNNWKNLKQAVPIKVTENQVTSGYSWLVTDGANKHIQTWALSHQPSYIVTIGQSIDNISISQLSTRPSFSKAGLLEGVVTLENKGLQDRDISLNINNGDKNISTDIVHIAAKQKILHKFIVQKSAKYIKAGIDNTDSFIQDNTLILDLEKKKFNKIELIGDCNKNMKAAVKANLGIDEVKTGIGSGYKVYCDGTIKISENNSMVFHSTTGGVRIEGTPIWEAENLSREAPIFQHAKYKVQESENTGFTILSLNGKSLISKRAGKNIIDIWLSIDELVDTDSAAYALLINTLLNHLTKQNLVDQIQNIESQYINLSIIPLTIKTNGLHNKHGKGSSQNIVYVLILVSLLLLLSDFKRHFKTISKQRTYAS